MIYLRRILLPNLLITLILSILSFVVFTVINPGLLSVYPFVLLFFFVVSIAFLIPLYHFAENNLPAFSRVFMVAIFLKLFISLGFFIFYVLVIFVSLVQFVLFFSVLYIIYSVYEISAILHFLKEKK